MARLFGAPPETPYPKDGINDHVIHGAATINPDRRGTKCAAWYRLEVAPGGTVELRLRLRPRKTRAAAFGQPFGRVLAARRKEADEFYAGLTPRTASEDEARVMRQAFGGLLWSKQLYYYDVARWLDGDPAQPPPPASRQTGRNSRWRNFNSFDIMSMPDKWEYPWFAAWDLAFHCVALAHVDPAFAKYQLILLCREWFQHPNGALPAYEWDFSDVNPPVQACAALEVFAIDGARDLNFLSRVFDKLLVNFTWWVNRGGRRRQQPLRGRFPGPGQHRPDRPVPPAGRRHAGAVGRDRLDGVLRHRHGLHRDRAHTGAGSGRATIWSSSSWNTSPPSAPGDRQPGAVGRPGRHVLRPAAHPRRQRGPGQGPVHGRDHPDAGGRRGRRADDRSRAHDQQAIRGYADRRGLHDREKLQETGLMRGEPGSQRLLLSVVGIDRLEKLFTKMFNESEFLSPYGLRALSAYHRDHPYELDVEGFNATIDYEPAESTTDMFGGNSNWRGPLWFPLNYLICASLERYARFFGDDLTFEYPTGSGQQKSLADIVNDLQSRLISIFLTGADGRRPCFGWVDRLQHDPAWKDNLMFNEYFHGDNAAGLGASHQTGWTGVVADLIRRRHGDIRPVGDIVRELREQDKR